ncbi:MAG TPA: Rrf2 family transcriptional regulator, partial [Acidobacteriaceae bacterium]
MQLRNHVEWALHCCAILAGLPEGRYLATKDLAELHGVPKEYLSKALQALSAAALVESVVGPSGGYRLAKAPAKITFLDIVEAVEGRQSTFE